MDVDFRSQRANMIESQVRTNDVSDAALIAAIGKVKREEFADAKNIIFAYAEVAVKSKSGRSLLLPRDFSKLAQAAMVNQGDEVLIIAGSGGYSAAVFGAMGANVTIIDNVTAPSTDSAAIVGNIETLVDLGGQTYDVIFVDGGVAQIPTSWVEKLKENGRMCVITLENGVGNAKVFVKSNGRLSSRTIFDAKPPILTELNKSCEFVF